MSGVAAMASARRSAGRAGDRPAGGAAFHAAHPGATALQRLPQSCACGGSCPRCRDSAAPRPPRPPVSNAADASEREAEQLASRLTGTVVQPRSAAPAPAPPLSPGLVAGALHSPHLPLDPALRRPLQAGLGRSLDTVRLHVGGAAARSAAALRARAWSLGEHVVFGAGEYAPHSAAGRHLLVHELVHTLQPGARQTLHRADLDYRIERLPDDAASRGSDIFFERGSATLAASEQAKIAALATPAGRNLTLHGFASEDAGAADRAARVRQRLDAVEAALVAAGHTGTRVRMPHADEGVGDIDYRNRRKVQVLPTPSGSVSAPSGVNPCGAAGSEVAAGAQATRCETKFTEAFPSAKAIVDKAEKDLVTTPTAAAGAVVTRFFSGVPRADINANVTAIATQVRRLGTAHRCHTNCDGGCDRPGYNSGSGSGTGAGGAMMTLCPDFVSASLDFRIELLLHEAAHANPRESIKDIAYSSTRLIPFLLASDSRRNTDSYVLLMRLVHTPGSMAVGPAAADLPSGMTGTGAGSDTEQTERAVAWLESWLNYGDFDTGILYQTLVNSLAAGVWVTSGSNEFNIRTMHRLATAFTPDLVDPGADGSARTTPPVQTDKLRVAAIHDRYSQMYSSVNQRQLTITRVPAGTTEAWTRSATGTLLAPSLVVSEPFFTLGRVDQVKRLVKLMVRARTDISVGYEDKYVQAIDLIRQHRSLGP